MFSIVIPIYNRPGELRELLESLAEQDYVSEFEVLVVEDGSEKPSDQVIEDFRETLNLLYFTKENSGPGLSRNYGFERASGDFFIVLDSDCILPKHYLSYLSEEHKRNGFDAFGGPDRAHEGFTNRQKAIDFAMTSWLTTGGLRGKKGEQKDFQLRSFNMGLSKEAFERTSGFSAQRIAEDIDLSFRLKAEGFQLRYLPEAYVYHKRRNNWQDFFRQTNRFGSARPISNKKFPGSAKLTYWFPSLFALGLCFGLLAGVVGHYWVLELYLIYLAMVFLFSSFKHGSIKVGFLSVRATLTQFLGYGSGFLSVWLKLNVMRQSPEQAFPYMFGSH